jgi:hypothetical protein
MTVRKWASAAVALAWLVVGVVVVVGIDGPRGHVFSLALVGAALLTIGRFTLPHAEMVRAVYVLGRADERREQQRDRVPLG